MKRKLLILLSILIGISTAYSQGGIWSGDLEVQGVKLPLVFHLDEENPTMDSPAQAAKRIPVKVLKTLQDSISIEIPAVGAIFRGKYLGNEITGTFSQRGFGLPLMLRPVDKKSHRPQTPQPPYPYQQQEVSFSNSDAVLKGTLTLPEGYNRETPVVLMITGSGLQNRDEEMFDHKPFAVIADALARNGIASLRYDDRGFGESTGDVANCTTVDLMNDALSGIHLLRQKFDRVGALGHSEGGTIALMLGADGKVDFIVSLAAMVISGEETLLEQNRLLLIQAGYPTEVVDEYCGLLSVAFKDPQSLLSRLESSSLPAELKHNLSSALRQLSTPSMQYFLTLDMRDRLSEIHCPVLALNGKRDTQVSYESNLNALSNGLPSNALNKVMALDELNHLFQHCATGAVNEYGTIQETISPEVLKIISQWVTSD